MYLCTLTFLHVSSSSPKTMPCAGSQKLTDIFCLSNMAACCQKVAKWYLSGYLTVQAPEYLWWKQRILGYEEAEL